MTWVRTVEDRDAEAYLETLYEGMRKQRGFVPNIVKSMSIRPELTRAWMGLYATLMFGQSELSRAEREMIATVVSVANRCHY